MTLDELKLEVGADLPITDQEHLDSEALKTEEIFGAERQQHIKPKDLPVPKLRRKIRYSN